LKKTFYSNGKLLITGEYVVLDGAKAFALPTKYGQNLTIEKGSNKTIYWKSYDYDGTIWFDSSFSFSSIITKESFDDAENIKNTLIEILHQAYLLNPDFVQNEPGYLIETQLTFPKAWGLGTSSTLINNIAQWLQIDAFELLKNSFGGSGYDIACAQNNTSITYQLVDNTPVIEKINFYPNFVDNIYFVYLNKKQNSRTAISAYYAKQNNSDKLISKINTITQSVISASESSDFANQLHKHEIAMSFLLEMQTCKEALFPDFPGVIKSLGAWGGDFVMAVSEENPTSYFNNRGYSTVLPYKEMIL
jgi:mevalonate kinase